MEIRETLGPFAPGIAPQKRTRPDLPRLRLENGSDDCVDLSHESPDGKRAKSTGEYPRPLYNIAVLSSTELSSDEEDSNIEDQLAKVESQNRAHPHFGSGLFKLSSASVFEQIPGARREAFHQSLRICLKRLPVADHEYQKCLSGLYTTGRAAIEAQQLNDPATMANELFDAWLRSEVDGHHSSTESMLDFFLDNRTIRLTHNLQGHFLLDHLQALPFDQTRFDKAFALIARSNSLARGGQGANLHRLHERLIGMYREHAQFGVATDQLAALVRKLCANYPEKNRHQTLAAVYSHVADHQDVQPYLDELGDALRQAPDCKQFSAALCSLAIVLDAMKTTDPSFLKVFVNLSHAVAQSPLDEVTTIQFMEKLNANYLRMVADTHPAIPQASLYLTEAIVAKRFLCNNDVNQALADNLHPALQKAQDPARRMNEFPFVTQQVLSQYRRWYIWLPPGNLRTAVQQTVVPAGSDSPLPRSMIEMIAEAQARQTFDARKCGLLEAAACLENVLPAGVLQVQATEIMQRLEQATKKLTVITTHGSEATPSTGQNIRHPAAYSDTKIRERIADVRTALHRYEN